MSVLVVDSGVLFFNVGLVYPYSRACNDDGPSPGARPAAGKEERPAAGDKGVRGVPPRCLPAFANTRDGTRTVGTPSKEVREESDTTPHSATS